MLYGCLAALLWIASTSAAVADRHRAITFTFAPTDGAQFNRVVAITRERHVPGEPVRVDESELMAEIRIAATDDGWAIHSRPTSMVSRRDGEPVKNPVLELVSSIPVTIRLDQAGRLQAVEGYDTFVDNLAARVSPEVMEALLPVLDTDALRRREAADWNSRIGDFVGISVNIGDRFRAEVPFVLPDGEEIRYDIITEISGVEPCGIGECLRIRQVFDSAAGDWAPRTGEMLEDLGIPGSDGGEDASADVGARISGQVSRLIDPLTMLVHGETASRRMDLPVPDPDGGQVMTSTRETRVFHYQYPL